MDNKSQYDEKIVQINRVSKKTKGGNKMRFSALAVVGDRKGKVGVGLGKSADVYYFFVVLTLIIHIA